MQHTFACQSLPARLRTSRRKALCCHCHLLECFTFTITPGPSNALRIPEWVGQGLK